MKFTMLDEVTRLVRTRWMAENVTAASYSRNGPITPLQQREGV